MKLFIALFLLSLNVHASQMGNFGWDYEARKWQTNILNSSGTLSGTSYITGTQFMHQTKRWGLRPLLGRVGLYLGGNTNAIQCPIIHDWFTTADGNDELIDFVAADYSEALGLTGNKTTKYIKPNGSDGVSLGAHTSPTNLHIGVYNRTPTNDNTLQIGRSGGASGSTYIAISQGTTLTFLHMGINPATVADSEGVGFYQSVRSASDNAKMYKNGSVIITDTTADASTMGGTAPVVHAFNSSGTVGAWTARTLSYYAFGFAMNDTQAASYYKAVRNVQLRTGRSVAQ